jgi:hypothetical protein
LVATKIFCDMGDKHAFNTLCDDISSLSDLFAVATLEGGKGHNAELFLKLTKRALPGVPTAKGKSVLRLALQGEKLFPIPDSDRAYTNVSVSGTYPECLANYPYVMWDGHDLVPVPDTLRVNTNQRLTSRDVATILNAYYRVHAAKSVFRILTEVTCKGALFDPVAVKQAFAPDSKVVLAYNHRSWELKEGAHILLPKALKSIKDPIRVSAMGEFIRAMADTGVEDVEDESDSSPPTPGLQDLGDTFVADVLDEDAVRAADMFGPNTRIGRDYEAAIEALRDTTIDPENLN